MFLDEINIKKEYIFGLVYTFCFLIIIGLINYFTWTEGPVTNIKFTNICIWAALYLPFFSYYYIFDDWKIKEFGFALNYRVFFILIAVFIFVLFNYHLFSFDNWKTSFIEMFARTGEELFFRGFLYALFLRIFKNKDKSWIWAVISSSICFSLVHTQTFLAGYDATMIDIFILALIIAISRKLTDSILLGIVIHVLIKSNILGVCFGIAGYFLFILLSLLRGEKVF